MEKNLNCLRCKGRMEQGFMLDHTHGAHLVSKWVKGPAVKSKWQEGTVKIPEYTLEITAYRCTACGYLESYAK